MYVVGEGKTIGVKYTWKRQKTVIPQCFINEESLDYLLFKKLPMNVYSKKFTKSTDLNRQPNSCVAWKVQSQITNSQILEDPFVHICQIFLFRQTPTNRTWWIWLLVLGSFRKQILTAALWFTSGQR